MLTGLSGTDLALMDTVGRVLEHLGLPTKVKTGKRMYD